MSLASRVPVLQCRSVRVQAGVDCLYGFDSGTAEVLVVNVVVAQQVCGVVGADDTQHAQRIRPDFPDGVCPGWAGEFFPAGQGPFGDGTHMLGVGVDDQAVRANSSPSGSW